jgi:hypothetical protein
MSTETTIYGASDDLIEVDGAISEEFLPDGGFGMVACSNGVLLRVTYDLDGVWRIVPLAGADKVTITQAPADDEDNYSDRAVITERLSWVALATAWAS